MNSLMIFAAALAASLGSQPGERKEDVAEARSTMHAFGRCVADRSPAMSAETLSMDFRTTRYRSRLRELADNNRDCFRSGVMRAGNLAFAGAVAEHLVERGGEAVNVRLARASLRPAARSYSPSDTAAMCVIRSVPDQVGRLFASAPETSEEAEAAGELQPVLSRCSRGATRAEASAAGLRAMLATAAFRALRAVEQPIAAGN